MAALLQSFFLTCLATTLRVCKALVVRKHVLHYLICDIHYYTFFMGFMYGGSTGFWGEKKKSVSVGEKKKIVQQQ